ncbi:winged helix-turn-helix domain-containing protein [Serratia ureilytica]|uniref:winged helix-turn-helix domain-containing protein n=1 Tax=Serratia ureilytica TaxID=300181 RepID=UPI00249BE49F|nr:winged helix-turn-helix domain-containing protein [Serratia ureilytica]MDI3197835.1 winged helix-turn-helix domain-containing protein [Serratia ureilytica]
MRYIINNTLVFDTNEQTLALYENALIVTRISKPAGRLLLEFIQNAQQIVSRDELLEKVWARHGFSASNAGLNNYISELRKTFILLGCHQELLVTLPKKGFRFEADILLGDSAEDKPYFNANENEEEEAALTVADIPDERQGHEKKSGSASRKILPWRLMIAASATIVIFISGLYIYLGKDDKHYPYQEITKVDNCDIYTVGKNTDTARLESIIPTLLKREGVDCKNDKNDIFYMENRLNRSFIRSDLISICSKDKNNIYNTCFNVKNQRNTTK